MIADTKIRLPSTRHQRRTITHLLAWDTGDTQCGITVRLFSSERMCPAGLFARVTCPQCRKARRQS